MFRSQKLADNLAQCDKVILFAATLGIDADKLLQRYEIMNMAKASVAQACGAACMEAYCNLVQEQIREQYKAEECYLRPRFSPGYGDLSLLNQNIFFRLLNCTQKIGLTLMDSFIMAPEKSITAFIGLEKAKEN